MKSPLVTPLALSNLLQQQGELVVVDCRFSLGDPAQGELDYENAHIPAAHYLHLDRDLSGPVVPGVSGRHPLPDPLVLAARLGGLGVGSNSTVVAYDADHGAFAARLWWLLRWLGHEKVAVLDGGMKAWLAAGYPVTASVPAQSQPDALTPLGVHLRAEMLVDAEQVERMRTLSQTRLFDARGADRFRGENESIDPIAGHIPGALSLPFMENLHDGKLRPREELRRRFEQALVGAPPEKAVVYCGSGVTACHNLLAAEHAGLSGMRLYAGSWSEWITDPSRQVATGSD